MRKQAFTERGFTLLEILVVVVIIGILTALMMPNLNTGGRWRDLQREANTLSGRIRIAQDDAMLYGHEYGIAFTKTGYTFVVWDNTSFRFRAPTHTEARWSRREFDDDIYLLAAANDNEPILILPEKPTDTAEATSTQQDPSAEPDYQPSVFVLSSGEVTPFTAIFHADSEERTVELQVDALGKRIDLSSTPAVGGGA